MQPLIKPTLKSEIRASIFIRGKGSNIGDLSLFSCVFGEDVILVQMFTNGVNSSELDMNQLIMNPVLGVLLKCIVMRTDTELES